jgi:hypothetical protein
MGQAKPIQAERGAAKREDLVQKEEERDQYGCTGEEG